MGLFNCFCFCFCFGFGDVFNEMAEMLDWIESVGRVNGFPVSLLYPKFLDMLVFYEACNLLGLYGDMYYGFMSYVNYSMMLDVWI